MECPSGTQCIPEILLCDGWFDCEDGSDEDEDFCRGFSVKLKFQLNFATLPNVPDCRPLEDFFGHKKHDNLVLVMEFNGQ